MDESNTNCPKCNEKMEEGFIVDHTSNVNVPSNWIEGKPVKSFWGGTKISDKKNYQIKTLRCVRCGFLESYATEEPSSNSIFT